MTPAEITQKYKNQQGLTLQKFADAFSPEGEHLTPQTVKAWLDDNSTPNHYLLHWAICHFPQGTWQYNWASEVLIAIR